MEILQKTQQGKRKAETNKCSTLSFRADCLPGQSYTPALQQTLEITPATARWGDRLLS